MSTLYEKLRNTIKALTESFVEREELVRLALLAVLAREHIVILGPPGTAKSLLARKLCSIINDGLYFDYLLTRFTTPDELFGPLSVKSLEEDQYIRKVEQYFPSAHIAFLDEIFKANSSILNSLLTLINERKFHNGSQFIDVPLISIIGASNEMPEEDVGLEALYDRFLVRFTVDYVKNENNFKMIAFGSAGEFQPEEFLTVKELEKIRKKIKSIKIPSEVQKVILDIREKMREEALVASDRRWKQAINFLKTSAATMNKKKVSDIDVILLRYLLWEKPEQQKRIGQIIEDRVGSGDNRSSEIKQKLMDTKEIFNEMLVDKITCPHCKEFFQESEFHRRGDQYTCPECKKKFRYDSEYKCRTMPSTQLEFTKKQVEEFEKELQSSRDEVKKRRRTIEDQLEEHLWVINVDLVQQLDSEIGVLSELQNEFNDFKEELEKIN
ncbi:MAG: AAA domain-containing protein [Candidatus Heimdallarchaeota archaeon]|nr:AAA domain-containing protein [Candidatus Heimdallarchaeota archaeon]